MEDRVFYGVRDDLGVCALLFRFDGKAFVVGPYAPAEFDPIKTYRVLIAHRMQASLSASIRLYISSLPIQSSFQVRRTLSACIGAFEGGTAEYGYCRVQSDAPDAAPARPAPEEETDLGSLYQRYEAENRFLGMIELGDTANVLNAQRDMNMRGMEKYRYASAVYYDPNVSNAMLRALARKAAERGGASIIEIHEITQRAVQRMAAAKTPVEHVQHNFTMIYELTEAVSRARHQTGNYSPPVKKAVEYLHHNFSGKISMPQLAKHVGLSEAYLSKAFKKETGSTISRYTARLRCKQAAELLQTTDIPVQDISGYVGYPDNNYFVKVFKASYGATPTEYREGK